MRKTAFHLIVNFGLLLGGLIMVFSGLLIQAEYHMEGLDKSERVFGLIYQTWSDVHIFSSIAVSIIMILHIGQHWKWYKIVLRKRLFIKNHQVLILTLIFIATAITGLFPWMIDLNNGDQIQRKIIIEIHDKIALILFAYLIIHIVKRFKWYIDHSKAMSCKPQNKY